MEGRIGGMEAGTDLCHRHGARFGQVVVKLPEIEYVAVFLEVDPLPDPRGAMRARGGPISTVVAPTLFEDSVPITATCSPTVTLENDGEDTLGSTYLVDEPTSTVTVDPLAVDSVKVSSPTDLTVPTAAGGPPGPPGPKPPEPCTPAGGAPISTVVAVTVLEDSVPITATCSPTVTLEKDGEDTLGSTYLVDEPTSTVTIEPLAVVRVKVSSPTDLTVPTAAGGDPQAAMPPDWAVSADPLDDEGVPDDPEEDAAPATPPAIASPSATAAAVVTRTPRLRRVDEPAASAAVPDAGSASTYSPGRIGPDPSPACPTSPGPDMLGWRRGS